jgi:hypothetical protein
MAVGTSVLGGLSLFSCDLLVILGGNDHEREVCEPTSVAVAWDHSLGPSLITFGIEEPFGILHIESLGSLVVVFILDRPEGRISGVTLGTAAFGSGQLTLSHETLHDIVGSVPSVGAVEQSANDCVVVTVVEQPHEGSEMIEHERLRFGLGDLWAVVLEVRERRPHTPDVLGPGLKRLWA